MVKVVRWGNSLAIRLPAAVVKALELQPGDEITIEAADPIRPKAKPDPGLQKVIARLDALGLSLPPGFRFARDETPRK